MNQRYSQMRTHSIYAEILHSLAIDRNVSHSFRQFGVAAASKRVVVVVIGGDEQETICGLKRLICGDLIEFVIDANSVELGKVYRATNLSVLEGSALSGMAVSNF